MPIETYSIHFNGFWREEKKHGVPSESGIYCVYSCVREDKVIVKKLIYIGESQNVNYRIKDHEKLQQWTARLKPGEELCYNFGGVPSLERLRCETALIFKHKPVANTDYVDFFPYDKTNMTLTGETAKLKTSFSVTETLP